MIIRTLHSISEVPASLWPAAPGYPFLSPAFLGALESTGAANTASGWTPRHLLLEENGRPLALLPLYLKTHSRGEYVFDHSWADAYQRHGLEYFPRLVSSIPFTPVEGPRCLLAAGTTLDAVGPALLDGIRAQVIATGASSWHGLFLPPDWQALCAKAGFALRLGCQFAWTDENHGDFAGFLASLTSKRRKNLKAERRRVADQGIRCRRLHGPDISSGEWDFFFRCYQRTYQLRGQRPYLARAFFSAIAIAMPEQLVLMLAEHDGQPLAAALFFRDDSTLYGRYWGSVQDIDCLHFELCYYQGIEYCLEQGLRHFDPGTQGEHKLMRGFRPVLTRSAHWLAEPAFMTAVKQFVNEEAEYVRRYQQEAATHLPFRQEFTQHPGQDLAQDTTQDATQEITEDTTQNTRQNTRD
jgi:predicted N-acyltransferase